MIYHHDETVQLYHGDALDVLRTLPDDSVHCCVTSPPYFGLRDYNNPAQIGLEETPQEYVTRLVDVFREVWRVLRSDGTCWLNLGDSYAANRSYEVTPTKWQSLDFDTSNAQRVLEGYKLKDLLGIPWRVAFALQDDGWYLRSDIIWHKQNPMPESVKDRPTRSHEHIFLLTKSARYWYDAAAIAEPYAREYMDGPGFGGFANRREIKYSVVGNTATGPQAKVNPGGTRNVRDVWAFASTPYPGAHFAVFPPELPRRCILAGCPEGGVVLDPFAGSGTTAAVARKAGRRAIAIELNETYCGLILDKLAQRVLPLFGEDEE